MARCKFVVLILAVLVLHVSAQEDGKDLAKDHASLMKKNSSKTSTTTEPPIPTTPTIITPKTTTSITTLSPPTTASPSTTSTAVPTTTPSVTSSSKPFTTTVIPSSSPAPSPTTTNKPVEDIWVVNNNSKNCILAKMNITLKIKYNSTDHKVSELNLHNRMEDVNVSGSCDDGMNSLILHKGKNVIEFDFSLKNESKNYYVSNIFVELDPALLNITAKDLILMSYKRDEFLTKVNNSYQCSSPSPFKLSNSLNFEQSEMVLADVTLEAFRNNTERNFSSPVNCVLVVPDIVPIVVGCILALLVVIILVGYLIGRKRSQARGYMSM